MKNNILSEEISKRVQTAKLIIENVATTKQIEKVKQSCDITTKEAIKKINQGVKAEGEDCNVDDVVNNIIKDKNHYTKKDETKEATSAGGGGTGSFEGPLSGPLKKPKLTESKKKLYLTESQLIDMIEKIINEQKVPNKHSESDAFKTSKKDNEDHINAVIKKLLDYTKNMSNAKKTFEMESESIPKGNGEFKKEEVAAFRNDDEIEEFIKYYFRGGGNEDLAYDNIEPNKERMKAYIKGSKLTGNSDEYTNAIKTNGNDEVEERNEKKVLNKLKKMSYNKDKQPITDKPNNEKNTKIAENVEKMINLINFDYTKNSGK